MTGLASAPFKGETDDAPPVHGDRDEFFPVVIPMGMYRAIPESQLWIVPDGDHVPIFGERTAEFLRIVRAFLRGPEQEAR